MVALAVDSDQDGLIIGFEVVHDAVAATFAALGVTIFDPDFVNFILKTLKTISGLVTCLKMISKSFRIIKDMRVTFLQFPRGA
ncbi:MAG: hypothetical protein ABI700_13235 [Chloroflexota bacterium]